MKKIGIITHFHGSMNYGGVLQACALCHSLKNMGYEPEQIRFHMDYTRKRTMGEIVRKLINPARLINFMEYRIKRFWREKKLNGRRNAFQSFNASHIPSTDSVYDPYSIAACNGNYDAFITGSDQVWNPDDYFGAFFLDFVSSEKTKISYAASIGKSKLTPEHAVRMEAHLKDFTAVSVREQNAVSLVQPLTELPVELVLDPTLLMDKEQWNVMCSQRLVSKPYLFCFFLGYDSKARKLARKYAKKHGLTIATIPHASSLYVKGGSTWGDVRLWDASPSDFLSLIKYAECVFTDSFHACAFSTVYEKEFFVFRRAGQAGMSGRIESLLDLLSSRARFCDTKDRQRTSYIDAQLPIDYKAAAETLETLRIASREYLKRNI